MHMHETTPQPARERVVLAGMSLSGDSATLFEQDMAEMELLCDTAGVDVVARVVQRRQSIVASTYFGSGKLDEIRATMRAHDSRALIVDAELSPGQVRNIEKAVSAKVLDRSQLILDIFAQHARTNEAKVQVELAQMRTLYPRLTRAWSHFSRQYAGVGTKGPGEKQLEVDRRLIQRRIAELTRRLANVERARKTQRQARRHLPRVALVGYTNVGKSSLLNRLARAHAHVENKLFATLDTTTRRVHIPGAGQVVMSDTVGFLRKLPHHLVASFRSTLEVVRDNELLLIVMDASGDWNDVQLETVEGVLDELGAQGQPRLQVVNKIDLVDDPYRRKKLELAFPDALFVSAQTGEGIEELKQHIALSLRERHKHEAMEAAITRKSQPAQQELPGPPPA
ncbi:MAG: GTPase HflX [Chitinivibrionales bacterium]|nr:GTPase HflX [Chitinivibrionales bacterium]